ncbi:MAG: ATP-binding protein [Chitinophagales bacterium]|nr:ATP-binding protein [Chitinophagales bacterium]
MIELYEFNDNLLQNTTSNYFRYLMQEIDWSERLIAIKGSRGVGKTTLMLQYMKYILKQPETSLYITADHYWFYTHNLVQTADIFYKNGGRFLFIDEVHKYPNWSREIKNIYDGFPEMKIVFTSSSILDIYKGEADLSRRLISYNMQGLSYREYLEISGFISGMSSIKISDIQADAYNITQSIIEKIQHPLPTFRNYLKTGYFPFSAQNNEHTTLKKLNQIINTIIETDLAAMEGFDVKTTFKLKKLLGVIAESTPFKPNISALARKLDVSRETIYHWLVLLEKANILSLLIAQGRGVSTLQKPDKIFLENSNWCYALSSQPNIGTVREVFLMSQLSNAGLTIKMPKVGDFYIEEYDLVIEVGGQSKTIDQVKNENNYLLALDDIENARGKKIPLWLFGFLY